MAELSDRGPNDSSPVHSQAEPLIETLNHRHALVTQLTKKYYEGDVIPPSTKAQILRAQKFSVFYYYMMNAVFFLYAFFIPAFLPAPYFGGLDPRDFHADSPHIVMMAVVLVLPLIRFVILSWSAEFYHYGLVLAGFEGAGLFFVALFWSPGLPVLLSLFVANMINIAVTQIYWKGHFIRVVRDLEMLVPPSAGKVNDHTTLSLWPGLYQTYIDFRKLWGFTKPVTQAALYDERCGVFSGKDQMSHVKAMFSAYMQAVEPRARWVPWRHSMEELWQLNPLGLLNGLLGTFVSNLSYALSGLWLGSVLFINWFHGPYAVMVAVLMILIFCVSMARTKHWLEEGLGVAVAEKEWLAHDVVKHQGEREEMLFDVLDLAGSGSQSATESYGLARAARESAGLDTMLRGRLNLTFMWCCVASNADFIGESYLAKMYWNLATESRFMIEALTPYDFKLFYHAKWEVTIKGCFIKVAQTLLVAAMTCLYFGSYYNEDPLPVPLMGIIGAACFVEGVLKMMEAVQFAFTILGNGGPTHRHAYVSESIVIVILIFVLICILVWLYLLPIMKGWDLPVGKCQLELNRWLFPSACQKFVTEEN